MREREKRCLRCKFWNREHITEDIRRKHYWCECKNEKTKKSIIVGHTHGEVNQLFTYQYFGCMNFEERGQK